MNVVVDTIMRRQNCKKFQERLPEMDKLNTVLSCGRCATDGLNMQSVHFYVITSKSVLEKLNDVVQNELTNTTDATLYQQSLVQGITHNKDSFYFNAPAVIVLTDYDNNPHATSDCISAAQNMAIAASSLGLGSNQLHHLRMLNHSTKVRELLHMSENEQIHAALALGYINNESGFMPAKKVFGNPIILVDHE
jgi:nitroreductase